MKNLVEGENWQPTNTIRWWSVVTDHILMQKWVNNAGEYKWEEVKEITVTEFENP